MITVDQLIDLLKKCPPNAMVITAKDAEGNGYSPLSGISFGMYEETNGWSGELVSNWTAEKPAIKVVILEPVN